MKQWFWWLEKNKVSFLDYQIATIQIDYIFEVIYDQRTRKKCRG